MRKAIDRSSDISVLYDPNIVCGDRYELNLDKEKSFKAGSIFVAFLVCMLLIAIYYRGWWVIVWLSVFILCLISIISSNSRVKNPILVIDKTGITHYGKFYSWDRIDHIRYFPKSTPDDHDCIVFYLKSKFTFTIASALIFKGPFKEWTNYIIKHFPNK